MPTTPEQLIEQATRHAAHLESLKTQNLNDVLVLIAGIEIDILGRLSNANITQWSRGRLEKQLTAYQLALEGRYNEISGLINTQVKELLKFESEFEINNLSTVLDHNFTLPTTGQLVAATNIAPLSIKGIDNGSMMKSFIGNWSDDQVINITNTIRSGFAQGRTTAQIIRELKSDILTTNRRRIEGLTRTVLQHAAVQAREITWSHNSDVVKTVLIVSVLDGKTSIYCRALDGAEFPINSGPRPPFHPFCRTTTVAGLDSRFKFLDKGATRRERDPTTGEVGYVPADTTYYGWLKAQPRAVQESIIGPARTSLLNDGGLTAQRFTDLQLSKTFIPRTLEQMRELEPIAFMKANLS